MTRGIDLGHIVYPWLVERASEYCHSLRSANKSRIDRDPKTGVGWRCLTTPFSHFSEEVSLLIGISVSPLNSVNGTGLGIHDAKIAASR